MTQSSIKDQVSRILSSDTSKVLVSQLKSMNSFQSTIEQELLQKTAQIHKLQTFLRTQIQNIQTIVEANNQLKRQLQVLKQDLNDKEEENKTLQRLLEESDSKNKKYSDTIYSLQQKNFQLQVEIRAKNQHPKCLSSTAWAQTEGDFKMGNQSQQHHNKIYNHTSISTSPQQPKVYESIPSQAQLLDKISELEQTIATLALEKTQLHFKLKALQSPHTESVYQTEPNEEEEEHSMLKSPYEIIAEICQELVEEVKFRGELVNGVKQGKGICYYQGDIQYQGAFQQGKRQGLGTLYAYGQSIYRGYWVNGLIEGKGVLNMIEGEIQTYEGQFRQGRLEGYGCMKLKSGKRIMGFWKDGKIQGKCMQSVQNSRRYIQPQLIQCY